MLFINIVFLQILIYSYFLDRLYSLQRIWIIRHCDKPNGITNPCCSQLGYNRAKNWHLYFNKYIQKNTRLEIYTSNYNEKKVCLSDIGDYKSNRICQKSQRMFLTALYLQDNLKNFYNKINLGFCVGEKNRLLTNIFNNSEISDAIIIWEHTEIVQIIREFGIKISRWRNKQVNEYNIVFLININTKQLYYDCFDFISNNTLCSKNTELWLHGIPKINNYYDNILSLNNILLSNINTHQKEFTILYCVLILNLFFLLYLIIKSYLRSKRRYNYIEIK